MKWMEEEKDVKKLEQRFRETYLADAQKANLCRRVAQKEKVLLESRPFEKEYTLEFHFARQHAFTVLLPHFRWLVLATGWMHI